MWGFRGFRDVPASWTLDPITKMWTPPPFDSAKAEKESQELREWISTIRSPPDPPSPVEPARGAVEEPPVEPAAPASPTPAQLEAWWPGPACSAGIPGEVDGPSVVENEGLLQDENEDDVEIRDMVAAVICSNKSCGDVYAVKFLESDDAEGDPQQECTTTEWRCRSCGDDLEIIQAWRDDGDNREYDLHEPLTERPLTEEEISDLIDRTDDPEPQDNATTEDDFLAPDADEVPDGNFWEAPMGPEPDQVPETSLGVSTGVSTGSFHSGCYNSAPANGGVPLFLGPQDPEDNDGAPRLTLLMCSSQTCPRMFCAGNVANKFYVCDLCMSFMKFMKNGDDLFQEMIEE